jgi:serine/threonine protein kinase
MSEDTPKYEIVEYIGKGGMGEVFRGVSHGADGFRRDVAIKRLRSSKALDYDARRRFLQEAKLSAALDHPNIVPAFDYIKDKEGHVCLIMAFVDGVDLHDLMEAERLPVPVSVYIISSVLQGLAHAHRHGIIHRDITPGNIMISRAGAVQITDFGLAHDTRSPGVPCEGGTPGFMSPEALQVLSEDARSDLFSVGVVLYELLTGTRAFPGTRRFDRIVQTLSKPPPPPIEIRPEIPRLLSDITMRLLAKDPADRFASAVEVIDALPHAKYGSEDLAALIEERKPPRRPAAGLSSEDQRTTKERIQNDPGTGGTLWQPANAGNTVIIPEPVPISISQDPEVVLMVLDPAATGGRPPGRTMPANATAAKPAIGSIRSASPAADGGGAVSNSEDPGRGAERPEQTPALPGPVSEPRAGGHRKLYVALAAIAALFLFAVLGQRTLRQGQPPDSLPYTTAPGVALAPSIAEPSPDALATAPEVMRPETRTTADTRPSTAAERAKTAVEETTAEPVDTTAANLPASVTAARVGDAGREGRARARKQQREGQEAIRAPSRWREIPIGTETPWDIPIQRGANP